MAHVDAGKTTLSEAMLYKSGTRDKLGRVDKRDAFLDTHAIERERGITVFSKQATLSLPKTEVTLIDTPGHIDFTAETERSLAIQDYAILVVSAPEGITAHTRTLWEMLTVRRIPTFVFVNKTDICERRRIDLLSEIRCVFGNCACDFNLEGEDEGRFFEECAACDEALMREYFDTGSLTLEKIAEAIRGRRIIPTVFGSALKCAGVDVLLSVLDKYTVNRRYSDTLFGAKVFKIETAPDGARLTHMKITGGVLSPKDTLRIITAHGKEYSEKVESIRLYSSDKYKNLTSAPAGTVCAVVGLFHTAAGMGLGVEANEGITTAPVLDYSLAFKDRSTDVYAAYLKLLTLSEEEPTLGMRYDHKAREIRVNLIGEIQIEVLTRIIKERFGLDVYFERGTILYRETVSDISYGAGHFEPLMHYAEVRLRIEPLPAGSGMCFATDCPTDTLSINWQRLILSHLGEKTHRGPLTGSPLTDMKITLITGKAHPKHTEGGDFREATYRALNQAMRKAEAVLLEPTFNFALTVPEECVGRAMTDITNMHGEYEPPEFENGNATLIGTCPVFTMHSYAKEVRAYTHGGGRLLLEVGEYVPCHNADQIISESGYSPELDSDANADSIFCRGGAGYSVPWYEADEKMHTENPELRRTDAAMTASEDGSRPEKKGKKHDTPYREAEANERELMRIFEATYGKIKPRRFSEKTEIKAQEKPARRRSEKPRGDDYLIIDGYNLIFAWDELRALSDVDLSHARDTLIHLLSNYRGFKRCNIILVFDAYKRKDNEGSVTECGGITVVYTKERQTADAYIERSTYNLSEKNSVRVVTSDYVEQLIVLGNGALRVSTKEFIAELKSVSALALEWAVAKPH